MSSKPKSLDALDASKAGVSQAELEESFLSLATLEEEMAEADSNVEAALTKKRKAKEDLASANENLRSALAVRDPIAEELARASWIVRNADPDHPAPPMGNRPPGIKSVRS